MRSEKTPRICEKGHKFYKSSDCDSCPVCEAERKPADGFLSKFSAPARRALEREGIFGVEQLSNYTEKEILSLHGIGKSALSKMKEALEEAGLKFKND
ncbi:RNA polymerase alpha subunit C-terminal domain-containing protein [Ureibacillus sp. FSL K6-8385]|uniref:RNA polymerase alpha subunit C-terminal domain-containing protein n=1 Tax=Ureibacillus terrenus TaxID=118246 RepID=A0A540V5S5_9BACL|nr:RNA polymerase alpha subunit C-terminal domain-containing protein [Ureibacillus terrenus]MED3661232.1 RNA polymerase alpha subunit C-terminal domain-containing protein [Ureibacillus terrenus]MED3764293.1 RNA polymerase alpha subunit C-terminal domain-containing protein [Ureibacillus terrenus]TQE92092.1 hypothetical protein FKZ59_02720 [Ureibacillus terrenus]